MAAASSLHSALDKLSSAVERVIAFMNAKQSVDVPAEAIENGDIVRDVGERMSAIADRLVQAIPTTGVYVDRAAIGAAPAGTTGATGATGSASLFDDGSTGATGDAKSSKGKSSP